MSLHDVSSSVCGIEYFSSRLSSYVYKYVNCYRDVRAVEVYNLYIFYCAIQPWPSQSLDINIVLIVILNSYCSYCIASSPPLLIAFC